MVGFIKYRNTVGYFGKWIRKVPWERKLNGELPLLSRCKAIWRHNYCDSRPLQTACIRHYSSLPPEETLGPHENIHLKSLRQPEEFWGKVSEGIEWFKPFEKVLDNSNPPFTKWFVNGKLNACYNAVDRHVSCGNGDTLAIIHESPITSTMSTLTYKELLDRVSRLAGLLSSLGVNKGDSILIYLPMIPEAVIAMLAAARLGAVHSLVFGGFAATELAVRMSDCKAKVVLSASYGVEPGRDVYYKPILDEAIHLSNHKPKHCVIFQREGRENGPMTPNRDVDWMEEVQKAKPHDAVPVDSNEAVYILYTSGTTGAPKGVVRPVGGHCVVLPWTMKALYDIEPGDVWWAASDLGWVVGHSYICYAPLLYGCTTIIYEGKPVGTPDASQFFRVVAQHQVKGLFTAPTALRAIEREDPEGNFRKGYSTASLQNLYVAGEPLDYGTRCWSEKAFGCPVLDHWWQTETGSAITAHSVGLQMDRNPPRGSTGKAFIGYDVKVVNNEGKDVKSGELGRILVKMPLPPGNFSSLHNADERFVDTYFKLYPGYYDTMDAGTIDQNGYVSVQSRQDDVINVAGHRLSTLALEEAMLGHPDIVEAAVIGVPDKLKGEVPLGLFVKTNNCSKEEHSIRQEVAAEVRKRIGPVAAFKLCSSVAGLPKTRSGKVPRKTFSDLARSQQVIIPPTIEDPKLYDEVLRALISCGFAKDAPQPKFRE